MDSPQFNVVVDGSVLDGFDTAAVLEQLQQQLKLPESKAHMLIAGKPVTVKRNVDEATANAYCKRLQALGVNAHVAPSVDNNSASTVTDSKHAAPKTGAPTQRYFSDLSLAAGELRNSSAFRRAVSRASIALYGVVLGYAVLTLVGVGLFLFYVVGYASFLKVPPLLFSATVYLTVTIVLAIMVALLLRPYLTQRRERYSDVLLSPLQEPALFDFIRLLCEKLALKIPEQIVLTTATTHSASLLPGFKNFKNGDYRLSLSLPALDNGTLKQFAGALAADLATQATLSMLRYRWLADLLHDQFDDCRNDRDWLAQRLASLVQAPPTKLQRVFTPAGKIIKQANQYLQKISDYLARIDAKLQRPLLLEQDRYSALIAGSDHFADLMIFQTRLTTAAHDAHTKNREERIEGGLVDDLPTLIKHYFDEVAEDFARRLQRKWEAEATPRSDEPPILRERIEHIKSIAKPALIDDEQPARCLLRQRDALAQQLTLSTYRDAHLTFDSANLMPVDELTYAATQDILQRQQAAIYFNDWFRPFRFWSVADYKLIRDMPLQDAAAQLSVCVNEIRRLTPDRAKLLGEYERLHNQLREILIAQHVIAAGKKFAFRYIHYDGTTLAPLLEERHKDIADVMEKLAQQEAVMGGRITLGLRLSGQAEKEVQELHDALRLLHDLSARLYKIGLDCFQLEQLLHRQYALQEADYSLAIKKFASKIDDASTLLLVRLNDIPYPLSSRYRSLKSFVEARLVTPAEKQPSLILQRARRVLDALFHVNEKLSQQSAEYSTTAEEAYRIEPIRLVSAE